MTASAQPLNPIVVIPARMASTRLPGKPLAMIGGAPMVVQVWRRAMEAGIGPVIVACAEEEIRDAVLAAGGEAVLTDPGHPSGSDRAFEAVQLYDPEGEHDAVVNLQGDLPALDPAAIRAVCAPLAGEGVDIATLACPIEDEEEAANPNVVKAVISLEEGARIGRGLWFTRLPAPGGEGPMFHHIGIYAYRREALSRFVALDPAPLEKREKLEQLRALEAGMRIDVALVDTLPLGVDTPADLERIRAHLAGKGAG